MSLLCRITRLSSSPFALQQSQASFQAISRHFASSTSGSDEDDSKGADSETINFDSKAYRTWVENALKGANPEAEIDSKRIDEVVNRAKAEDLGTPASLAADTGSIQPGDSSELPLPLVELESLGSSAGRSPEEECLVTAEAEESFVTKGAEEGLFKAGAEESLVTVGAEGGLVTEGAEGGSISERAEESLSTEGAEGPSTDPRLDTLGASPSSEILEQDSEIDSLPQERLAKHRLTVRESEALLHGLPVPVSGYRELASTSFRARHAEDLQLSQGRKFRPGDVYDTEDLTARVRNWEEKAWLKAYKQTTKATNPVALRETDFRNVSFLHKFTSEAGNLPARRVTRLQKKVHAHVMRNIKTARTMGLMPRMGKIPELMPSFKSRN